MKKWLLFAFLFILCGQLSAQGLNQRIKTENSFFVLKNEKNFLPLKRLDTLKIGLKIKGNLNAKIFYESALRYTDKIDTSGIEGGNLSVYLVSGGGSLNYTQPGKPYIVLIFGAKVNDLPENSFFRNAKSVIISNLNDSLTQDYAAQLIFGAFSAYGKDTIKGGVRFKYTIPQEIGLDSTILARKTDSIVNRGIELKAFPGCQVFISVRKKVIFYKSYGYHTYEGNLPVTNSDLYDFASITKIAASVPCLMKLAEEGKLNVNDKISDYYKPFRHSNKRDITFKDALTHQARLTAWIPFWKKLLFDKQGNFRSKAVSTRKTRKYNIKVADGIYLHKKYKRLIFKEIKKSPLLKEKRYKYSDLSFYIYPLIIEKLTGKDFYTCLKENFYDRLGAYTLCFNPLQYYDCSRIVPTEVDKVFRKQLICGYVHDEGAAMLGGISGHAGLFGTANDLAKLMQMYCDYGVYGGERYLDSSLVLEWTSYQFKEQGNRRGLGFDKPLLQHKDLGTPSPLASDESFGHSGFTGTFAWADPKYDFVFVFLSNRVYPSREYKNLLKYNIRPSIHTVVYQLLEKSGKK